MNRFWHCVILPVLKKIDAKVIVEIGCAQGKNTRNILSYCVDNNAILYAIDPFPGFDVQDFKNEYGDRFVFYQELSLSALPLIDRYDVVLIDGDHNWYTVYNELKIIEKMAQKSGHFPLVFLHDVGWPYGRRDLYYNPENIPEMYRQPYKKQGLIPGQSRLAEEGGINAHLYNAIYENNPRNGVLTAIEDFLAELLIPLSLYKITGFHGLAIVIDKNYVNKEALDCLQNITAFTVLNEELEAARLDNEVTINSLRQKLLAQNNKLLEQSKKIESDFEKELKVLNEKVTLLDAELRMVNQKNSSLKLQLNTLKKDKDSLLADVSKRDSEKAALHNKVNQLSKDLQHKVQRIGQLEKLNQAILSTVRYRLGDVLISALKPSKNTILLPFRLVKLLAQGILQVKERRSRYKKKNIFEKALVEQTETYYHSLQEYIAQEHEKLVRDLQENINLKLPDNRPFVSIIVLNRNGANHLRRLLTSIKENTIYPHYEIIIVDNNSSDDSLVVIDEFKKAVEIKVIINETNKSFSEANNQAAQTAEGEYLLLLNNDTQPAIAGWLNELVKYAVSKTNIGAVGARLIYPMAHPKQNRRLRIQHIGIAFRYEGDFIRPYNMGTGNSPLDFKSNLPSQRAGVTGAALLIKKETYFKVGGLDEGYIYGYEDVDLCLKLHKAGYINLYCPTSLIYHYEFGTQERDCSEEVRERRINNRLLLQKKWHPWLKRQIWADKLSSRKMFSERPLKVAFAVTESGPEAAAGDYFTAMELGEAMKQLGWEISFLNRKGPGDWYEVGADTDVVISMLESYDPRKIKGARPDLIKIAWLRNWFERWIEMPGFNHYDIVFASSQIACDLVQGKTGREAILFPIATNAARFSNTGEASEKFACDYCFTGSYWNDPREIIDHLCPDELPYKFNLYGKNWEKVKKFRPYHKGFLNYELIPQAYKGTKIVIDDANRVTKPYGAVNSRVFDALASGALVLTNGELGSTGTFKGKLPVFRDKHELKELIVYYLNNENERLKKVKELQDFVFQNHTYEHRATHIKNILTNYIKKHRITIKIAAPKWETVHEWGDYHLALGLKKQFEIKGYPTIIQILPEWDTNQDANCDVVIVFRGLNAYTPKPIHFNIMWNISHPDKVTIDEYNQYDHVFIASEIWAQEIASKANVKVEPMLQCTDPDLFKPDYSPNCQHELLFVGNSRKVYRKIIKDLLPTDKDLAVYGTNWRQFIDGNYVKGEHIPNEELNKYYSSCKILLNDHWDDMREKGFISNRLFDGFAAGAFIISDRVKGAEEVFGDALVTYESSKELKELISYYLGNSEERKNKAERARILVIQAHTYKARVEKFIELIRNIDKPH